MSEEFSLAEQFDRAAVLLDIGEVTTGFARAARACGQEFWGDGYTDGRIDNPDERMATAAASIEIVLENRNNWGALARSAVLNMLIATDDTKLRKSAVHLAAIAAGWIEAIDRRNKPKGPIQEQLDAPVTPNGAAVDPFSDEVLDAFLARKFGQSLSTTEGSTQK